jgi:pimeloyl-ACP methyl ester carboxylesterase
MSEQAVTFGPSGALVGVLHTPALDRSRPDLPAVLMLNAGILDRVGPNRVYVRIARELESRGFSVLRFDLAGIGDSETGAAATPRTFFDDTSDAMALMQQRVGASRFLLMGVCMGAKIALEIARRDARVETLVLMEGIYVKSARYHLSRLLDPSKWQRLVNGESHFVRKLRRRLRRERRDEAPPPAPAARLPSLLDESVERNMAETLRGLVRRGTRVMLVFRDGNEIGYNYRLRRDGDSITAVGLPANLHVAFVPFADHTFTPVVSQELLVRATMPWIDARYPNLPVRPAAIAM